MAISSSGDSPIVGVGVDQAGRVVCSGVLVDARVVLTAASCAMPAPTCLFIAGACVTPSAPSFDPAGRVAAFTLPSDATPIPLAYGRSDTPPGPGDELSALGENDSAASTVTIVSTDGQIYNASTGGLAFVATDLGAPGTFAPAEQDDGTTPADAVYGILITLPTASAPTAVFARVDVLARDFVDPLVQGTRDVDEPGGCSIARPRRPFSARR